jgi:hypothetical protein
MNKMQLLEQEMEETRKQFLALLDSIPESDYNLPTNNPAWSVGDMLYHVTLGPQALSFEIWMIIHARGLFQFTMRYFPSKLFNRINARFSRRGNKITCATLINLYEAGHTKVIASLRKTREEDLQKSIIYPADLEAMLAGKTSVERLFHYVKDHFEAHRNSIRK